MADAARMMLSDHPFGVGPNHTSCLQISVATIKSWPELANNGAMFTTSTGLSLRKLIPRPCRFCNIAAACANGRVLVWLAQSKGQRGDLLIGLGVGLLTVYLHSFMNVFITFGLSTFAASAGMVAGLAQQRLLARTKPVSSEKHRTCRDYRKYCLEFSD